MTSLRLPLLFALAQWLLRWRILLQLVPVAARSSFPEIETQMVWIYVYESASILPQDFEIVSFFLGLRSWPERLAGLAFLSGGVKVSFLFFVVCKLSLCFRIF